MKEGKDFAILTDEITKAWADKTVKGYKELKQNKQVAKQGGTVAKKSKKRD